MSRESGLGAAKSPTIAGFRDLVPIARGGFSTVYTAYQDAFARTVAIKVLRSDGHDPVAQEQFRRECEAVGRLTGQPHIVTVFDAGATVDNQPFIAMQYLRHGSLVDLVVRAGPRPAAEVVHVGAAIAYALAAAHAAGIVHGDVKPGNILISDQGEPVLSDFGVAVLAGSRRGEGAEWLTDAHCAPEVLNGEAPTPRSDIYALGSTLNALLNGSPGRAGVPPTLADLLARMLSADPAQRPASATALADELAAIVADHDRRLLPLDAGVGPNVARPPAGEPTRLRQPAAEPVRRACIPWSALRRWRLPLAAGAAVVALTTVGLAFALPRAGGQHRGNGPAPATSSSGQLASASTPQRTQGDSPAPAPSGSDRPTPTSTPLRVADTEVTLNMAAGHGCKAWIDAETPGPWAQAQIQSFGDDCEAALYRSLNGTTFAIVSSQRRIHSGTDQTHYYWDGDSYVARACLTDYTTTTQACGKPYGPGTGA